MKINKEMLEGSFKLSKTYEIWSHEDLDDGDSIDVHYVVN